MVALDIRCEYAQNRKKRRTRLGVFWYRYSKALDGCAVLLLLPIFSVALSNRCCIAFFPSPCLLSQSPRSDGTNFGCLYDGVTAGGLINCHAAQAFAEYTLRWLAVNQPRLSIERDSCQLAFSQLFNECTHFSNNPGGDRQAEGGSATGVAASIVRRKRRLVLVGASIGDAACIVLNPGEDAAAVTKWHRVETNPKDSGGELMMSIGVQGIITAFVYPVTPNSMVILSTDGLTDNVLRSDLNRLLPLIVCSKFFEDGVEKPYPARHSRLPSFETVWELCKAAPRQELDRVSVGSATRRITNYVHWVTRSLFREEQRYYALELAVKKLRGLEDAAAALTIISQTLEQYALPSTARASAQPATPSKPTHSLFVDDDGSDDDADGAVKRDSSRQQEGEAGKRAAAETTSDAVETGAKTETAAQTAETTSAATEEQTGASRAQDGTGEVNSEVAHSDAGAEAGAEAKAEAEAEAARVVKTAVPAATTGETRVSPVGFKASEVGAKVETQDFNSGRRARQVHHLLMQELRAVNTVADMTDILQHHLAAMQRARKAHRSAGKTDDAMVVVFRPLQKAASS